MLFAQLPAVQVAVTVTPFTRSPVAMSITRSVAVSRGNDALLFGWTDGLTFQQVLATRTLHYDPARPRVRAVR